VYGDVPSQTPRLQYHVRRLIALNPAVAKLGGSHLSGLGLPIHIANMAVYLASGEAAITTGQVFPVDSGVTIHSGLAARQAPIAGAAGGSCDRASRRCCPGAARDWRERDASPGCPDARCERRGFPAWPACKRQVAGTFA
jgi:hypothetical protein